PEFGAHWAIACQKEVDAMPLNAFIVRPFGVKEVSVSSAETYAKLQELSKPGVKHRVVRSTRSLGDTGPWSAHISFDDIDELLIQRAMTALGIKAETTEAVVRAGNIREDMFNRLVTADLVIADLTFYNPNVFYELGVRQAFRDK